MEKIYFQEYRSPVGELSIYSDHKNLLAVTFKQNQEQVLNQLSIENPEQKSAPVIHDAKGNPAQRIGVQIKNPSKPSVDNPVTRDRGHAAPLPGTVTTRPVLTEKPQPAPVKPQQPAPTRKPVPQQPIPAPKPAPAPAPGKTCPAGKKC